MNPDIFAYVKDLRAKGYNDNIIRQELAKGGWQSADIEKVLVIPTPARPSGLIIGFIVLLLIASGGIFLYFRLSSKPPVTKVAAVPTPIAAGQQLLVYQTKLDPESLSVYDFSTNTTTSIKVGPTGAASESAYFAEMGSWSPDGKLLPIQVAQDAMHDHVLILLFSIDTLQAKSIYDGPRNIDYDLGTSSFGFAQSWRGNTQIVLGRGINGGQLNIIDLTGNLSKLPFTGQFLQQSNQLTYSNPLTSPTGSISAVTIAGNQTPVTIPGQIIGLINNLLVTLNSPKGASLADPQAMAKLETQFEELKKLNLSEAELASRSLAIMEPTGDTTLYFQPFDPKQSNFQIALTDGTWRSIFALADPAKNAIVVHQTDKLHLPQNQRFLLVSPETKNTKIVYQSGLGNYPNPNYLSSEMFQHSSFSLSPDGNWLIIFDGDWTTDPSSSQIYAVNIDTGEKRIICATSCIDYRMYSPTKIDILYP